jgi:hypothetical protein
MLDCKSEDGVMLVNGGQVTHWLAGRFMHFKFCTSISRIYIETSAAGSEEVRQRRLQVLDLHLNTIHLGHIFLLVSDLKCTRVKWPVLALDKVGTTRCHESYL